MTNLWDYPSLQVAIDATPPGGTLHIGRQRVSFEHVVVNHGLTIRGSGQELGMRPTFGSPQWVMPSLDHTIAGSVLECTATEGIAIKVTNCATLNLVDVMIRARQQINTVTGIEIGSGALSAGIWNYGANLSWKNAALCNFKVGLHAIEVYQSHIDLLQLWGCDTGAILGNAATSEGIATTLFTALDSSGCNVVIDASNIVNCTFANATFQGVQNTGLLLRKSNRCLFDSLYFENAAPCQWAINLQTGSANRFRGCGFSSGVADRFRIGSDHNVYEVAAQGVNTTIIDGHYNHIIGGGSLMTYLTDNGAWNYYEGHMTNVSTTTNTHYLRTEEWSAALANTPKRGGKLWKNGDPVLIDTVTGTKYRIQITNGALCAVAM